MKKNLRGSSNLGLVLIILAIITLAGAAIMYFVGGGREKASDIISEKSSENYTAPTPSGGKFVAAGDLPDSYEADPTAVEVTVKGQTLVYERTEYDLSGLMAELAKISKPEVTIVEEDADAAFLSSVKTAMRSAGMTIVEGGSTSEETDSEDAEVSAKDSAEDKEKAE